MIRASAMLLRHIGYSEAAEKMDIALDVCGAENKMIITGRDTGVTGEKYTRNIISIIDRPDLKAYWQKLRLT